MMGEWIDTRKSKANNVYKIGGVGVEFPYKPYGTQLAFMSQVIMTLERASRQGHCNALLESPTGTGKTLSLLCASLAWQRHHASKPQQVLVPSKDKDPLVSGGGFIPEIDPSGNGGGFPITEDNKRPNKRVVPTIFYASRTHAQISQVIRELRKTSYRVPMAILASKKHYCVNSRVCRKQNVDEECKLLLKDPDRGCVGSKNAQKLKSHPLLRKGGCLQVHDIEDIVKLGRRIEGCPYFASQIMAEKANIVFCPYNYVLHPTVRRAMDLNLNGTIIIFDEAHNIEDMARDAGSIDVEEDILDKLQVELAHLCLSDDTAEKIYQPLHEMIQGIITWISRRKDHLEKVEFEHYLSCWTGDHASRELEAAGISHRCFPVLQDCATKAIKAASDAELGMLHLSGISVATLEGLINSFSYLFSSGGKHLTDYQLALQRYVKRDGGRSVGVWTHCFSLWCLNPSVVFRELADLSLSVILTSGTLSPMNSFTSELGVQFQICMEAPHVINPESQVWAGVLSNGPDNACLNASYKMSGSYDFQDSLGLSLEEICKRAPGGALVFFPSYKLMDKMCCRWKKTGLWTRLCMKKPVFVEPRGSTEDFESVLRGYYDSIHGEGKTAPPKMKNRSKREFSQGTENKPLQNSSKGEAAFLAVCRGKVSEGIDFSDENARVVVIVGIPFPNKGDIKVNLKKKYNDKYRTSKKLLGGSDWYCHQAFRALNQAAGRCIRHKADYGAIIFLDERFTEESYVTNMPKWLRKSVKKYDNFSVGMEDLENFFPVAKEMSEAKYLNVGIPAFGNLHSSAFKATNISGSESETNKNINKLKNSNVCQRKVVPSDELTSPEGSALHKFSTTGKANNLRTIKYNRYLEDDSKGQCNDFCNEKFAFTEESCIGLNACHSDGDQHASLCASTTTHSECSDRWSYHSNNFVGASPSDGLVSTVTPDYFLSADTPNHEVESSLNASVNSYNLKTRNPICLSENLTEVNIMRTLEDECVQDADPIMYSSSKSEGRTQCPLGACSSDVTDENVKESCPEGSGMESFAVKPSPCDLGKNTERWSHCHTSNILTLSCSFCGSSLGHAERDLLMNCTFASSSKPCLRNLSRNALPVSSFHESPCGSGHQTVPAFVSDVNSVAQHLWLKRTTDSALDQAVCCKEDGCVFFPIYCSLCSSSQPYIGLQIMETNLLNTDLQDKIIFFKDRVSVKIVSNDQEEVSTSADGSVFVTASQPIQYKNSLVGSKRVSYVINKTSKLRLRRKVLED